MRTKTFLFALCLLILTSCSLFDTGGVPKLSIPNLNESGDGNQTFLGFIVDDSLFFVCQQKMVAYGGGPLSGYTWSVSNLSSLPVGTTFDPLTGIFKAQGGQIMEGSHEFEMTVSDGSRTASATFVFEVESYSVTSPFPIFQQPLGVDEIDLPEAHSDFDYGADLQAFGDGPLPWSWYLDTGELPPGMVIDQSTGTVRGKPMADAVGNTYSFTVKVVGDDGVSAYSDGLTYNIFVSE
ncbi:TPA: hypothetical protein DCW38_02390 [candidate division WOR-3 bacterium]|uniref:Dystroglycan-type cadherin-like domain-containing protein n=1 Tax=candidate division WOR-3 bacterium TaxID=2052148 RepID=A0A350H8Z6_UNCW3|nr:hypothetical protein [candidate division WOR-3 bacterium]